MEDSTTPLTPGFTIIIDTRGSGSRKDRYYKIISHSRARSPVRSPRRSRGSITFRPLSDLRRRLRTVVDDGQLLLAAPPCGVFLPLFFFCLSSSLRSTTPPRVVSIGGAAATARSAHTLLYLYLFVRLNSLSALFMCKNLTYSSASERARLLLYSYSGLLRYCFFFSVCASRSPARLHCGGFRWQKKTKNGCFASHFQRYFIVAVNAYLNL